MCMSGAAASGRAAGVTVPPQPSQGCAAPKAKPTGFTAMIIAVQASRDGLRYTAELPQIATLPQCRAAWESLAGGCSACSILRFCRGVVRGLSCWPKCPQQCSRQGDALRVCHLASGAHKVLVRQCCTGTTGDTTGGDIRAAGRHRNNPFARGNNSRIIR
jgi:hypothetical protein